MTLTYTEFRPKTSVKVWTWRGEEYNLTGDLISWQTSKSLTQPQGTFAIQLTDAKHNGVDWAQNIQPMDYVEIRASATGSTHKGELPIIMRGFIDAASHSFSIGNTGGPMEPRVLIQGRDYSKLLLEWQVLYLWTQNNAPQMANAAAGLGLVLNYGLPVAATSLQDFFTKTFGSMVGPIIQGLHQHWLPNIPNFVRIVDLPDYMMSSSMVQSYTGSFWNLFSYFVSPPFGELFVRDDPDYPALYARVTPYRSYIGITPSPGTELKPELNLPTAEMQSYNIGWTDNDVYTYYLTWGDQSQSQQITMPAYAVDSGNGVNMDNQSLYGTRPLIIDTPWVNAATGGNPIQIASELNQWLVQVMSGNNMFQSGNMTMQGREDYVVGKYGVVKDWDTEFYIADVNHQYTQFQRWDTSLQVVRGRPLSLSKSNNNTSGPTSHGNTATSGG